MNEKIFIDEENLDEIGRPKKHQQKITHRYYIDSILYRNRNNTKFKFGITITVLLIIAVVMSLYRIDKNEKNINIVKSGYLTDYSYKIPVGDVIDNFLENPKWHYSDGTVVCTGYAYYQNKRSEIQFRFNINKDNNKFSIIACYINNEKAKHLEPILFHMYETNYKLDSKGNFY